MFLNATRIVKIFSIAVFLALMSIGEFIVDIESARGRATEQARTLAEASTIRAALETELNSTIYLTIGLSGFLALDPQLDDESVETLLATVYSHGRNVRNIELAPDNRLDYIYPLAGNEAAIGLEYEKIPSQWPDVKRAIETRDTVVIGPVKLVQGGSGIVARTPVFLADGSYWGIVSMVIDVDSLLDSVAQSSAHADLRWAVRAGGDRDPAEWWVFGDRQLFDRFSLRQPVVIPGGSWELAAEADSTRDDSASRISLMRTVTVTVSATIAVLIFLVLREREHVHHLAVHDALTGLPNRRLFFDRVEQRIALAKRYGTSFCVLYVDLDDFKPVNDGYGHHAGDHVLKEIGARIRNVVRRSDTVARIGGDEFVLILPDTSEVSGAEALASKLIRTIGEPILFGDYRFQVGASIGITQSSGHGKTAEELLAVADTAMYEAKQRGKGQVFVLESPAT